MLPQGGGIGATARRKLSPLFNRNRAQMPRSKGLAGGYNFAPTRSAAQPEVSGPPRPTGRVATRPAMPPPTGAGQQGRAAPSPLAGTSSGLGGMKPAGPAGMPTGKSTTDSITRALQISEALPMDIQRGLEISALAKALGRLMKGGGSGAL